MLPYLRSNYILGRGMVCLWCDDESQRGDSYFSSGYGPYAFGLLNTARHMYITMATEQSDFQAGADRCRNMVCKACIQGAVMYCIQPTTGTNDATSHFPVNGSLRIEQRQRLIFVGSFHCFASATQVVLSYLNSIPFFCPLPLLPFAQAPHPIAKCLASPHLPFLPQRRLLRTFRPPHLRLRRLSKLATST